MTPHLAAVILESLGQQVETVIQNPFFRICSCSCLCFTVQVKSNFGEYGNDSQDRTGW